MNYRLALELSPPHAQDVKAVLAIDEYTLASASRDGSVAIWHRSDATSPFLLKGLLSGHDAYVNSLAHIEASSSGPVIASGGNSSLILLHSMSTLDPEPVQALIGHSLNVCALEYGDVAKRLISGSWDNTARVWRESSQGWETEHILDAHQQAVWGVAVVERGPQAGSYLTGSADLLIILWASDGTARARFKGHPEPVRALAVLSSETFASACNDGLLRIFDFSGSTHGVIEGHTDSVFCLKAGQNHLVVSAGEDHSARLWDTLSGREVARCVHPCQTVWSADVLLGGEIVTGGSNGRVRIWSADEKGWLDHEELKRFEEEVAEAMSSRRSDTSAKPGGTMIIDVDVSDEGNPLRLHVGPGAVPESVAADFVAQHGLPKSYIERISDFIRAHSDAPAKGS